MKDIRIAFRTLLLSDPTVMTLCGGRCYPVEFPENQRAPSLVYFRASGFADYHMRGDSGLEQIRMQLDSWADKHDSAVALADAAHDVLTGFRGRIVYGTDSPGAFIDIQGIFEMGERDLSDHTTRMFNMTRDFQISYEKF
jgi:hypothetical protein